MSGAEIMSGAESRKWVHQEPTGRTSYRCLPMLPMSTDVTDVYRRLPMSTRFGTDVNSCKCHTVSRV